MGVAALVLGIIGTLVSFIPVLGMYAIPLTVLALAFGALGLRKPKRGLATAGLVLGLVGTGIGGWQYTLSRKIEKELVNAASALDSAPGKAAAELAKGGETATAN